MSHFQTVMLNALKGAACAALAAALAQWGVHLTIDPHLTGLAALTGALLQGSWRGLTITLDIRRNGKS